MKPITFSLLIHTFHTTVFLLIISSYAFTTSSHSPYNDKPPLQSCSNSLLIIHLSNLRSLSFLHTFHTTVFLLIISSYAVTISFHSSYNNEQPLQSCSPNYTSLPLAFSIIHSYTSHYNLPPCYIFPRTRHFLPPLIPRTVQTASSITFKRLPYWHTTQYGSPCYRQGRRCQHT